MGNLAAEVHQPVIHEEVFLATFVLQMHSVILLLLLSLLQKKSSLIYWTIDIKVYRYICV